MKFYFSPEITLMLVFLIPLSCNAQNDKAVTKPVGGPCEGCEAIFEYGDKQLDPVDTLPLFQVNEPKLKISGTVFQRDGKTPAEGVILYIYHTNREGIYQTRGDEKGWARRHGFIRGWVKTDHTGQYTFYTFRPATYPDRSEPEHIHITIKEPDKNEYYLDDYVFEDDSFLISGHKKTFQNLGGSGVMKPFLKDGILNIHRDIILGLNIPNYE